MKRMILTIIVILLMGCSEVTYDYLALPASPIQHTNGTWWGINQNKIVRYHDEVYTYYVDNENLEDGHPTSSNPSPVHLIKIKSDFTFEIFDTLYTSRPINLVVDSLGILHVSVFEPTNMNNASIGKLSLYSYTFENGVYKRTDQVIVDNDGTEETVNIRFSMSADENDLILVYGMNKFEDLNQCVIIRRKSNDWKEEIIADNLGDDHYYPYAILDNNDVHVLSIQDTCYPEMTQFDYPCFYQFVRYHHNDKHFKVVDYSNHPISSKKPQLMEHLAFYKDSKDTIHIITRAWLDENSFKGTFDYITIDDQLHVMNTDYIKEDINWIRLFDIDGDVYMVANSYNQLYFINPVNEKSYKVPVSIDIDGSYLFTNHPRSGSTQDYLDVYLIPADPNTYSQVAHYLRFNKKDIKKWVE